MLFSLLLPLVLPAAYALVQGSACKQVTSSNCEPAPNNVFHLDSKADCVGLCDVYASNGIGCTFVAWLESDNINCHLYTLPFWQFISGCKVLGGPPNLTGCEVEHPEDSTCDVVRDGDCFYYGGILESVDNIDTWEFCKAYCSLSPDCEAWTFRAEPSLECRLLATNDRNCDISYFPSGVDQDDCGQVGTSTTTTTLASTTTAVPTTTSAIAPTTTTSTIVPTTTAKAGTGLLVVGGYHEDSVELWSPGTSCTLPSLPYDMDSPTVDILQGFPLACYSTSCYLLTGAGWLHWKDTIHYRQAHTSAVLEEGVLLVGGVKSPSTTEVLPWNGGEAREGFSLYPDREYHCSIQVSPTTIILSGGRDTYFLVSEYSNLGGEVTTRQLPDHITGRKLHACSLYTVGQSQVLIVTGGKDDGQHRLSSTELLDYSAPAGGWREAGQLPYSRTNFRAARLGQIVYVMGGHSDSQDAMDSILSWSPDTESWDQAGVLTTARRTQGVTEVSLAAVEDYCHVL